MRFFGETITGLQLTRSRPYQKNDNRFVEQKNSTLVRAYLGTARLDTAAQTAALNGLYDQMWVYYNLFQPVMHLKEKVARGTRLTRRWDTAKTPLERLFTTAVLSSERQEALKKKVAETNPRRLRQTIYSGLRELLRGEPPREMLDWAA